MPQTKTCSKCRRRKRAERFSRHPKTRDGLNSWCKDCTYARDCDENGKKTAAARDRQKRYTDGLRAKALDILGRACARCGFDDERALQVDHIDGGGLAEVRKIGKMAIYRKIIAGSDEYQTLCANCNWIKRYENGEVPEQWERRTK